MLTSFDEITTSQRRPVVVRHRVWRLITTACRQMWIVDPPSEMSLSWTEYLSLVGGSEALGEFLNLSLELQCQLLVECDRLLRANRLAAAASHLAHHMPGTVGATGNAREAPAASCSARHRAIRVRGRRLPVTKRSPGREAARG